MPPENIMSSVRFFWVFFLKSCLKALIECLTQAFLELWRSSKAQRVRYWLKNIFLASLLLRLVIRLLAGQTAWAAFLDDLTINILATLLLN
jgi:hypothetical protein